MYLTSIKLAGFKSFVDPTTIKFQSNLTAIVGPNGCGKSNVIDAIRWVIGESSAKNLRAESMSDVIFNGTNNRKPVGQASIELNFDNSDGSLGGEYARFQEISIRRVLTRDGTSTYFLNNTRCRRKDIIDVFLGTGLGPRSYAIIEQGMISKLIEAKPTDLRVYIEEAAGISKYKERRRETENRIKHTRENLERLTDLREELEKQLSRLKRQANAAERYKVLKQASRELKVQLQVIHWREFSQRYEVLDKSIREQTNIIERKVAELREIDARIENHRVTHTEKSDIVNEIQQQFYGLGNDITKLEQQINNAKERESQLRSDLETAQASAEELNEQIHEDQSQLDDVQHDIASLVEKTEEYRHEAQGATERLQHATDEMQAWQEQWDQFQQSNAATTRAFDVQQTQLQHMQQKLSSLQDRIDRKQQQFADLSLGELQELIDQDQESIEEINERSIGLHDQLEVLDEQIKSVRESNHQHQGELNEWHSQLQRAQGRLSSLEALQQAALHKNDDAQQRWLQQHGLSEQQRLAEIIQVAPGWETAAETVLASHLQAICVDDFTALSQALSDIGDVSMSFIKQRSGAQRTAQAETLLSQVRSDYDLSGLLSGIYLAKDTQDALEIASTLSAGESVVTQAGIWLSKNWLRVSNAQSEQTGVLSRQHEIEALVANINEHQAHISEVQERLEQGKDQLQQLEAQRDQQQLASRDFHKQSNEVQSRLSANKAKLEQIQQQTHHLQSELEEMQEQYHETAEQVQEAEGALSEMKNQMQDELAQKDSLLDEKESLKAALDEVRQNTELKKQKADEMQIRLQSCKNQVHYLEQGIERAKQQLSQLQTRSQSMAEQLSNVSEHTPEWAEALEEKLAMRLDVEGTLTEAKQALNHIDAALRQDEKLRSGIDQEQMSLREQMDQNRLDHQSIKVKLENIEEQILQSGFDRTTVLDLIPDDANPRQMQLDLEDCEQKIERLGPINLAAIDEYDEVSERKIYLDKQDTDLNEALNTLEGAIAKIDRETKHKFKTTFDAANAHFQEYFPKIFGGGRAGLELVGDDMLEAGVIVQAQPPGKRNSTIHLLSGGEKALTAISLVFSLFQLNPAPFCILDEVDAPLDDANVARYANLVEAMSEKVQFIYISHNKVAIEMAKQLCGVTMHEAGVSRMVSVDIDEAIKMADA